VRTIDASLTAGEQHEPMRHQIPVRDVKMTSQVVRRLEAKGLLQRQVDPGDSRARRLRLTAEGQRLARRAITAVERADAQFFRT
jgi:DNA-binding MarR family transcriptional regulator